MLKKFHHQESGFTLIELLATLAIATMLIGVVFGVLTTSINYNDKTQSHINLRNEANILLTELRQKHQGDNYELCYNQLLFKDNIDFQVIKLNQTIITENDCREVDTTKNFEVEFKLEDNQNNSYEIETVIEAKTLLADSISLEIPKPDKDPDFNDYIRENNVFVYANNIEINGSSTIKGNESTVVMKQSFSPASASKNYVEAKEIYINGNVNIHNFGLGNTVEPTSNVYIDGDVSFSGGNPKIYGHLKHTGSFYSPKYLGTSVVTESITQVDSIAFPGFKIPNLKEASWYEERGYTDNTSLSDNMRYFGTTPKLKGNKQDVIIASSEDIDLKGNVHVTGVLFAPNGEVNIQGSSTFRGIIIAKNVAIKGNSHVTFEMPSNEIELPF